MRRWWWPKVCVDSPVAARREWMSCTVQRLVVMVSQVLPGLPRLPPSQGNHISCTR